MTVVSGVASLVTATVALVALVGGYIQFVLRRALLPSVEFDVEFEMAYRGACQVVGEVTLVARNLGTNTVILRNVTCRIRYRLSTDAEDQRSDGIQPIFAHRLPTIKIAKERTFVQPHVAQRYQSPVALPATTQVVDILGRLDYRIRMGRITKFLIGRFAPPDPDFDWRHGVQNHPTRRVIALPADDA